jgi:hypothetical protein
MNPRITAAGAAMLAGLTFAASPTRACDSRYGATCEPAPAPAAATAPTPIQPTVRGRKPHRVAKVQPERKAHHGKRARLALSHHRRRPVAEPAEADLEPVAPTRLAIAVPARQETSAARRFREFLNPQSFALAANEDLRRPRLLAAHFSGEIADPDAVAAALSGPVEPVAQEAAPIIAHDQTTGDDSPSTPAVLTHNDATEVVRAARTDKETPHMSFVRWFFVAWGGVLTFASAVRMAVG